MVGKVITGVGGDSDGDAGPAPFGEFLEVVVPDGHLPLASAGQDVEMVHLFGEQHVGGARYQ